jgi:uncharacterized caspase-like protein
MRALLGTLVAALMLAGAAHAADKPLRGVALVIGQSAYTGSLPVLANPRNDATAMGRLLGELGFDVTTAMDDDRSRLVDQLGAFEAAAKDADVALVYYSGHGIEAGGENYLVPTDADLTTPAKAGATLVPVTELLDDLARTVPVTIVLLDACRSDAFPAGTMIQPPGAGTPAAARATGLGELRGPTPIARPGVPADSLGMVIGFAASPGQPALDGAPGEPNSPYAAALLKHLAAGGYSFGDLMTMVSEEVYLKTKARQLPWVNSSLRRVLSFGKAVEADDSDVAAIKAERRKLLLTIADAPDLARATVETVAARQDVPLDQVYAMLKALGVDTSDPEALGTQLEQGAERIKRLTAESPVAVDDSEITKLVALAAEADTEGALPVALDFWNRAVDRAGKVSASLGADAGAQHRALATIYGKAGDAAFLALDYQGAADRYAAAGREVADIDDDLSNTYKKQQAEALTSLGEFGGDTERLNDALHLYDEVMTYLDTKSGDDAWADAYNEFGYALSIYGDRQETTEYLEDAQHAFEQVAGIWTRDKRPVDWARVQNNLGNVLASLGDRQNDPQLWQQAMVVYNDALSVWTEADQPLDWARAQNNLGTVLHKLGTYGKDQGQLKGAADAYNAALRQWTLKAAPYDYAVASNNLGNTLTDLTAYSGKTADYRAGLDAYAAALTVWSRERQPLQWAAVQNNLGATYAALGRREKGADSFLKAIDAYNLCLTARTKDNDPRNWALTQYNLGLVLDDLAERQPAARIWQKAVEALDSALEVYDDDSTSDWADVQEYLGWSLAHLGALNKDRAMIRDGRAAMQNAYDFYKDQNGAADYYQKKLAAIDKLAKSVT